MRFEYSTKPVACAGTFGVFASLLDCQIPGNSVLAYLVSKNNFSLVSKSTCFPRISEKFFLLVTVLRAFRNYSGRIFQIRISTNIVYSLINSNGYISVFSEVLTSIILTEERVWPHFRDPGSCVLS